MATGGEQSLVALITSILAIIVSSSTFGWTIYRDAIRKPKFRVEVARKTIMQRGRPNDGPHLFVEAINMGPLPNRANSVYVRSGWWKRKFGDKKKASAFIYPDFGHHATTPAASRIEVGDRATFVFPYNADSFLKNDFVQLGVSDGYGRIHWCAKKEYQAAVSKFREDFPPRADANVAAE